MSIQTNEQKVPTKDVTRHAKQGKACAVKGVGPKTPKPRSLVSVKACRGTAKVSLLSVKGWKVKALSPGLFGTNGRRTGHEQGCRVTA